MSTDRIKITKSFVDSVPLAEKGKQVIHRDSDIIGFALRVTSVKVYIVERRVNGRTVRVKLGAHGELSPAQARDDAKQQLAKMSSGINPNEERREALERHERARHSTASIPTFKDASEHYLVEKTLKPKTIRDYRECIDDYFQDWADLKLTDITRKMVQDRHKLLSERSKARANLAMRFLRALFNFAISEYEDADHKQLVTENPVQILTVKSKWNKIRRRKGHVRNDQLHDWVNTLLKYKSRNEQRNNQYAFTNQDFMLLCVLTGFRRDEGESLPWDNMDLKYGTVTAKDTKNGEDNTLPMGDMLWQIMRDRYARKGGSIYVFPAPKSETGHIENRSGARRGVAKNCDITFTFHDLRRTFGTIAENLDIGQYTIKRLLNHTIDDNNDVTAGYVQVSMDKLRVAMNMIEDVVFNDEARETIKNRTLKEPRKEPVRLD